MINGIILDLDGVYFKNGTKNFLNNIASRYSIELEKVREVYLKSEFMKKYKRGEIKGKEFWKWAINKWEIKATQEDILKILEEGYELNPKAGKILQDMKKKGIKTIICSNNFKERIDMLEKKFKFQKEFDYVILSYKYGILKPELLEKVIEETKMKAEEILVIDDGEANIKSANELGYKTILCEDPDRIEEYVNERIRLTV